MCSNQSALYWLVIHICCSLFEKQNMAYCPPNYMDLTVKLMRKKNLLICRFDAAFSFFFLVALLCSISFVSFNDCKFSIWDPLSWYPLFRLVGLSIGLNAQQNLK